MQRGCVSLIIFFFGANFLSLRSGPLTFTRVGSPFQFLKCYPPQKKECSIQSNAVMCFAIRPLSLILTLHSQGFSDTGLNRYKAKINKKDGPRTSEKYNRERITGSQVMYSIVSTLIQSISFDVKLSFFL